MFEHGRALFRVLVGGEPVWCAAEARLDYTGVAVHPLLDLHADELSVRWLDSVQVSSLGRPVGLYEHLLQEGRLLPPIDRPAHVVGTALNYADAAKELGQLRPAKPSFYSKTPDCVAPPLADVSLPGFTESPLADYEVVLACVIARELPFGTQLDEAKGREAIAGYCLANEITWRRPFVEDHGLPFRAKNGFRATTVGPALFPRSVAERVHLLRVGALPEVRLRTSVERLGTVQDARSSGMIHPPIALLRHILEVTGLKRGDLVLTGTPAGVAFGSSGGIRKLGGLIASAISGTSTAHLEKSERFLRAGDRVSVSGDYLGHQLATIVPFAARASTMVPPTAL
jgi:2-keto-4-pentenoate hydratase/2-oxohepta-3-ene-1,7-dioic acid hydratase in catechol pathway